MATAATTIHKALIASPRRKATTPRAHAPTIASTSQGRWRSRLLLFFIFIFQPGWTERTASPSLALLASKTSPLRWSRALPRKKTVKKSEIKARGWRRATIFLPTEELTMSEQPSDRRRFRRIAFDARTTLAQNGWNWPVQLVDLSLKGLLVQRPEDWQGHRAELFDVDIRLDPQAHIKMQVRLTHDDDGQLGFVCEHIDLESIS